MWHPISSAPSDGTICRLRFRDALGYYAVPFDCFLHDDGNWYRIDPPLQMSGQPTHWMVADENDGLAYTETNPAPTPAAVEPME